MGTSQKSFETINDDIHIDSKLAAKLMEVSKNQRHLEDQESYTNVAGYSLQFLGCHHFRQWNEEIDEDEDVRLLTKRLVLFRLVPFGQCANYPLNDDKLGTMVDNSKQYFGSYKEFGEYVVDLNTFVELYFNAIEEQNEDRCAAYNDECTNDCASSIGNDASYYVCLKNCFLDKGVTNCMQFLGYDDADDDGEEIIDAADYVYCAEFDWATDDDSNDAFYYGPYCAAQGGQIRMSLFTDDTCTTEVSCNSGKGATCYEEKTYSVLPYSNDGIVQDTCVPCSTDYINLEGGGTLDEQTDFGYTRSVCSSLYTDAGRCETHFGSANDESSCAYIAGIKIIAEEGSPESIYKRPSITANISICVLTVASSFLVMHVFYLKSILGGVDVK